MTTHSNPPSIKETAFSCPHCGAYTSQYWFRTLAERTERNATPNIPDLGVLFTVKNDPNIPAELKGDLVEKIEKIQTGLVFFTNKDGHYPDHLVKNLHLSRCYNCNEVSVWQHNNLIFPNIKTGVTPNPDMPVDIRVDFDEARSIIDGSPRGAAALLRLCVQKLCTHLGEKGKNIDDDIASLVQKGLNPVVQKSLDIVRVVGNEAVHPGTIDLNDDRDTATHLLKLINSIVDQMISHPKTVEELYEKLPESKREAIERRDAHPGRRKITKE